MRLTQAALITTLLVSSAGGHQQTGTPAPNTTSDIEREDPRVQQIIARAEEHYKLGELNLRDGKRQAAREEFDKAVDAVLESGMDVRENKRLGTYFTDLTERIYRAENPADRHDSANSPRAGFTEQKFEPSPLDKLARAGDNQGEAEGTDGSGAIVCC